MDYDCGLVLYRDPWSCPLIPRTSFFYFGYRIRHMGQTIMIYFCSGGKDGCCSALGPILYSFAAYPIVSGILQHGALLHSSRSIGMCHDSFFKVISCSGCCSWFGAELVLWVASGCIVFRPDSCCLLCSFYILCFSFLSGHPSGWVGVSSSVVFVSRSLFFLS